MELENVNWSVLESQTLNKKVKVSFNNTHKI